MSTLPVSNTCINFSKRRAKLLSIIRPRKKFNEIQIARGKHLEGVEILGNLLLFFFFYDFNTFLKTNSSYVLHGKAVKLFSGVQPFR